MNTPIKCTDSIGPLFVVGNSRSGTTLMARMLRAHTDIYILNETHYFQNVPDTYFDDMSDEKIQNLLRQIEAIQKYGIYRKDKILTSPSFLCNAYGKGEIDSSDKYNLFYDVLHVIGNSLGKSIVGDQTPQTIFYIDELVHAYPNLKIINMVRDPRAAIFSQRGKWKAAKKLGQPVKEVIRSFFNYHPITLSFLWNRAISAGYASQEKYGNVKIHTIIFEELVSNPAMAMMQLCDFIGVEFQRKMLDVDIEGSSNVSLTDFQLRNERNGIQSSVKDEWRKKLSDGEVALIQLITRENMEKYGYQRVASQFPITIIPLLIYFPIHLFASFLLNFQRIGNPISYLVKRFK